MNYIKYLKLGLYLSFFFVPMLWLSGCTAELDASSFALSEEEYTIYNKKVDENRVSAGVNVYATLEPRDVGGHFAFDPLLLVVNQALKDFDGNITSTGGEKFLVDFARVDQKDRRKGGQHQSKISDANDQACR